MNLLKGIARRVRLAADAGMSTAEYAVGTVAAVAFAVVLYKVVQLGAVTWYGLLTWPLLGLSALLTLVAVGGFRLGLTIQDRLDQATFNRVILVVLGVLGAALVVRALI